MTLHIKLYLLVLLCALPVLASAQEPSAIFELESTTQGILIPRMDSLQRKAIANPVEGLLVFDMDTRSFWFRQSGNWTELVGNPSELRDQDNDTRITLENTPDEDTIRLVAGGHEILKTGGKVLKVGSQGGSVYIGKHAGETAPRDRHGNVFIGDAAGQNNTGSFSTGVGDSVLFMSGNTGRMTAFGYAAGMHSTDSLSTYIGYLAGKNATGNRSVHIGYNAGTNDQGTSNIVIGTFAGNDSLTGSVNVFVGKSAGSANQAGSSNTFIGESAGAKNIDGELNTFIGRVAGQRNQKGDRNTFIGAFSGGNPGADSLGSQNTFVGVVSGSRLTSGERNVFLGDAAGFDNRSGNYNTFVGEDAGIKNQVGSNNTYLGRAAGNNAIGSGNVFIGSHAGFNELESNKLYIANDSTDNPLIYGDFAAQLLKVNGNAKVTDSLAIGVTNQKAKLHVKDDGVSGQRTIVGVLESNISDRPALLFSEFPDSGIENGMSIEYNGAGNFSQGKMHINKSGGEPIITFRNTGSVGIGTTTPNAPLHVDSTVLFTGTFNEVNPGPIPTSGAGTRMMWYPDKAVFRAGDVDGNQWDENNVGEYSTAFGGRTKASGDYSLAAGRSATASGAAAISLGNFTLASGDYSSAFGFVNTAAGKSSTAMGEFLQANGYASTVVGMYNQALVSAQTQISPTTPLFIVGNGDGSTQQSNAMVVRKDGKVGIGTNSPNSLLTVAGQIETTSTGIKFPDGSTQSTSSFNTSWNLSGNTGTTSAKFLGTTDAQPMRFRTNNMNRMHIAVDGKVGIGTTDPQKTLDINGSAKISNSLGIGVANPTAKLHVKDDGVSSQRTIVGVLESNTSNRPTLLFSEFPVSGINNGMSIEYDGTSSGSNEKMYINKLGGDPLITFKNDGYVGINTTAPLAPLHILQENAVDPPALRIENVMTTGFWDIFMGSNNLYFGFNGVPKSYINPLNGAFTISSDLNLKQDITALKPVLSNIKNLNPVKYRYKSNPDSEKTIGFIAQEVEKLFPEVVSENNGLLAVNYDAFGVIAIQAIKEQQKIIEELEDSHQDLQAEIQTLKNELKEIKSWMSASNAKL